MLLSAILVISLFAFSNALPMDEDTALNSREKRFGLNWEEWFGLNFLNLDKFQQKAICRERVRGLKLVRLENGKVYYYANTAGKYWAAAREECLRLGMHLATFETKRENDLVIDYLSSIPDRYEDYVYFGLADTDDDGVYTWEGTGQTPAYTFWDSSYPSSGYCGSVYLDTDSPYWYDDGCENDQPYICEMEEPCNSFVRDLAIPYQYVAK